MPGRSHFDSLAPRPKVYSYKADKADANAALSAVGNPVTDCGDNTFYFIFDEPLGAEGDYIITVDAKGHEYGITVLAKDRKPTDFKFYFQLNNGKQVDFLDEVKVEDPETAKLDLSDFDGTVLMSFWKTGPQDGETYPTDKQLVKRKWIRIANSGD